MLVTPRDVSVFAALARYYVMSRPQLQRSCFVKPDGTGFVQDRVVRRRLQELLDAGFIARHRLFPEHQSFGSPLPVYYLTAKGRESLAALSRDEEILLTNCQTPSATLLPHWLELTDSHLRFDVVAAAHSDISILTWVNEFDVVNKDASKPEERFRLYSLLRDKPRRLICAPDAAFLLEVRGHRKVHYVEQDCGTTGVRQFAARKAQGYAELARQEKHRKHFPETTLPNFAVLAVTTTVARRDTLANTLKNVDGADCWRFVAKPDLVAQDVFFAPIFRSTSCEMKRLVKPAEDA